MATSAFGKAFAAARKAGETEFTFGGKKYNTRMKGETGPQVEPVHVDAEAGMTRGRRDYITSGKQSFDTETEFVPPNMSQYKPRREPKPLTEVRKPGTNTNYENSDATSETFKKGGSVKGWGIARGARKAKMY